jgi:hypothetical protein
LESKKNRLSFKRFINDSFVRWCDKKGNPFQTEIDLKRAKYSGDALVLATKKREQALGILLPTAFEITNDKKWQQGGELSNLYGLKL